MRTLPLFSSLFTGSLNRRSRRQQSATRLQPIAAESLEVRALMTASSLLAANSTADNDAIARIVNGTVTTQYPSVGMVGDASGFYGSGTLIGSQYVLTAGHCAEGVANTAGRFQIGNTVYSTSQVFLHPNYNANALGSDSANDIAIFKLDRPVTGVTPSPIYRSIPAVGQFYGNALDTDRKNAIAMQELNMRVSSVRRARGFVFTQRDSVRSHVKCLAADDGHGGAVVVLGSSNWLSSPFSALEVSVELTENRAAAAGLDLLRSIVSPLSSASRSIETLQFIASDLRRSRSALTSSADAGGSIPVRLSILQADDHERLIRRVAHEAEERFVCCTNKVGAPMVPAIFNPAEIAGRRLDDVRQMLGHADWYDLHTYELQTLKDNLRLFTPEVLGRINAAVVRAGHSLVKKSAEEVLKGRCDSFVVETDVHFPTDINLLHDAIRKTIECSAEVSDKLGLKGWRQSRYNLRQFKQSYRKIQQLKRSTSKDEAVREAKKEEIRDAHEDSIAEAAVYLQRANQTRIEVLATPRCLAL